MCRKTSLHLTLPSVASGGSSRLVPAYLRHFGRYGVPLDVVYGPGAPHGIALPKLLTPGAVMAAFRRAAAPAHETASG